MRLRRIKHGARQNCIEPVLLRIIHYLPVSARNKKAGQSIYDNPASGALINRTA